RSLIRIDLDTKAREQTTLEVSLIAITPDGDAWLISGETLWTWRVGAKPTRVDTPGAVDSLYVDRDRVFLHSSRAISLFEHGKLRVIPVPSTESWWPPGSPLAGVVDAQGIVSVVDLASGATIPISHALQNVVVRGRRVAFVTTMKGFSHAHPLVTIWTLAVPDDPAALRKWLVDITNARGVADTDAYVWN